MPNKASGSLKCTAPCQHTLRASSQLRTELPSHLPSPSTPKKIAHALLLVVVELDPGAQRSSPRSQRPSDCSLSHHADDPRHLRRVGKCDAVEQGSVSRRAEYARASYQGRDNYRALTCPTRSALGDHGWAPCAPARPEALLAVQTVHVANVGEYLCSIGHYRLNEGI